MKTCPIEIYGMSTIVNLNVLPLEAYNILLGMDWLYVHQTKVHCYEKAIECLNETGERTMLQEKRKPTAMRQILAMQTK